MARDLEILRGLRGDAILRARDENTPPSISDRVSYIVSSRRNSLARPTQTERDSYEVASAEFSGELGRLRTLIDGDQRRLQETLNEGEAPWVPGSLPVWKKE
jgi:hypothetical protein